jgi:hypothetical protein
MGGASTRFCAGFVDTGPVGPSANAQYQATMIMAAAKIGTRQSFFEHIFDPFSF